MPAPPRLDPKKLVLDEMSADVDVSTFSCDDDDLDDFLRTDALPLRDLGITRVHVGLYDGAVVGYMATLADAVQLKTSESKKLGLRHDDQHVIPAMKIGRLAVSSAFRQQYRGAGTELIRYAVDLATMASRTMGCRLLTVDAYAASVTFYEKLGFVRNKVTRPEARTVSMRFDISAKRLPAWLRGA
ncbi:MAG: GNAT family N-acetyltransferase [Deltaproteobacteria bacterium]|nr:GNAT family N-acetyltransferase [Deltaproteobacteria bacterium]